MMSNDIPSYQVPVPYRSGTTIRDILKAGKHIVSGNCDIRDKFFGFERTDTDEVIIDIVRLGRPATTSEVFLELHEHGYRPANVAELLAIATQEPHSDQHCWVAAIGQMSDENYFGDRATVFLRREQQGWHADLVLARDDNDVWGAHWSFAAVRK